MPIHPNTRRCTHIKLNAKQCGAPALTAQPYCRFHADLSHRRREVSMPILQTAADIQVAITDTIRALIEGRIHRLHAGTILFGLQLAQNGLRVGNFSQVKFIGDLADINPAERSVIMPALDDRQSIEEFEAELEAEQAAAEQQADVTEETSDVGAPPLSGQDSNSNIGAPPLSDRAQVESSTPSSPRSSTSHATDRVGGNTGRVGASTSRSTAKREKESFSNYATRAADHAEREAIYSTLKPTDWELAMAQALKRAPKDFLDSIPRDEFGDIHPTPEQQQEITRLTRAIFDNMSSTDSAAKKAVTSASTSGESNSASTAVKKPAATAQTDQRIPSSDELQEEVFAATST